MDVLASQQESSSKGFVRVHAGRLDLRRRLLTSYWMVSQWLTGFWRSGRPSGGCRDPRRPGMLS